MTETTVELLDSFGLELPCPLCGSCYRVPLRSVGVTQRALHKGCPGCAEDEGSPVLYGPLLDEKLLDDLEAAWFQIEKQAENLGGNVVKLR